MSITLNNFYCLKKILKNFKKNFKINRVYGSG
nr:MAG TPA: hypothetical protein [Crassvirales sp.]